jgi:hypothetical protein
VVVDWRVCGLEVEWRGGELLREEMAGCCFSLGEMQPSAKLGRKQRTCFYILRKLVRLEAYRDFSYFILVILFVQDSAGWVGREYL